MIGAIRGGAEDSDVAEMPGESRPGFIGTASALRFKTMTRSTEPSDFSRAPSTISFNRTSLPLRNVMSEVKTWLGASVVKFLSSKFGAIGSLCLESVVTL